MVSAVLRIGDTLDSQLLSSFFPPCMWNEERGREHLAKGGKGEEEEGVEQQ